MTTKNHDHKEEEPMSHQPMSAKQRFVLALAGIVVIGVGLFQVSGAQQNVVPRPSVPSARNAQIVEVVPYSQISPRHHVVYDLDRQTATLVEVDVSATPARLAVLSITPLSKVTPKP